MDLHNNVSIVPAITPRRVSAATAIVGSVVDRADFDAVEFALALGTLAATTVAGTVLVEHGDTVDDEAAPTDITDAAAVPDDQLLGTEAAAAFDQGDDDATRRIGYRGVKRYVRLTVTPASNDDNLDLAAVAILGSPRKAPVS